MRVRTVRRLCIVLTSVAAAGVIAVAGSGQTPHRNLGIKCPDAAVIAKNLC